MIRLLLILVLCGALTGLTTESPACSCIDGGGFFAIAENAAWQPGVLIVRAEVKSQEMHGIDVKILEIINGSEKRSTIRVWGDPGFMCRTYTTGFKTGERLVLILSRIKDASYQAEENGDYSLGGCGTFVLRDDGKSVIGRITGTDKEMSSDKFYRELNELIDKYSPDKARIFPVPTDNTLTVSVPDLNQPTLSMRIFTLSGQPLLTRQLEVGRQHPIDVSTWPVGMYIILFRSEFQSYTRRFLKQ
ncbi:T9SS type A sorting domain-containing protein [Larkinella terrae]|uniref:T9SS type A sorting domain-containing protein n=1 Tax=Larkinella terrae TaxID=2025311 RepID=A0A7K0ETI8_9BACT|nr:T9SS type A sorting domain-containing protein [Larkinella terrae]MRS65082.1 T9SS type A sorting domain-containing protein [Larkinella terrae]